MPIEQDQQGNAQKTPLVPTLNIPLSVLTQTFSYYAKRVATLKDKELEIFRSRLLSENPPTLQEVGSRFGISRERVRQIETRLKRRLKDFLKVQAGDIDHSET